MVFSTWEIFHLPTAPYLCGGNAAVVLWQCCESQCSLSQGTPELLGTTAAISDVTVLPCGPSGSQFAVDLTLLPFLEPGQGSLYALSILRLFLCPAERWSRDAACVECGGLQCGQGEGQDLGVPVGRGGRKSLPYAEDLQWGEGEGEVDPLQHSLSCHSLRPLACTVPREGHC